MLTLEDSNGKYMVCFTLTKQGRFPQIEKCVVVGTDNTATASALGRVVTVDQRQGQCLSRAGKSESCELCTQVQGALF